MKKIAIVVAALALCLSAWLFYSKEREHRRQSAYSAAMTPLERALPLGTSRANVEKYLRAKGVKYQVEYSGNSNPTYEIEIGEEPGDAVCEHWTVYVAMQFNENDQLQDVHVRKVGACR